MGTAHYHNSIQQQGYLMMWPGSARPAKENLPVFFKYKKGMSKGIPFLCGILFE
jgi:hypothetical protein